MAVSEIGNMVVIESVQLAHSSKEIHLLKSGSGLVSPKSKLFRLKPFFDNYDILRVDGCSNDALSIGNFQQRSIMLSDDSLYTKLLFRRGYIKCVHGGPQAVLATVRFRYRPLNVRNLRRATFINVLSVLHKNQFLFNRL